MKQREARAKGKCVPRVETACAKALRPEEDNMRGANGLWGWSVVSGGQNGGQ